MEDAVKDVVRSVAKSMENSGCSGLRLQVEEAIDAQSGNQLSVTIALAGVLVAAAGQAWRIAWDLYVEHGKRKGREGRDPQLRSFVEAAVRAELQSASIEDQATRASLIKLTTEAVMARLPSSPS